MTSVVCLHFNMQEQDILEHTNTKVWESAFERHMSWGDNNDEVIGH